jgi:hypothetical protein
VERVLKLLAKLSAKNVNQIAIHMRVFIAVVALTQHFCLQQRLLLCHRQSEHHCNTKSPVRWRIRTSIKYH